MIPFETMSDIKGFQDYHFPLEITKSYIYNHPNHKKSRNDSFRDDEWY